MMIRKIWELLWHQNRNNFEKIEKRKDQAPLKKYNVLQKKKKKKLCLTKHRPDDETEHLVHKDSLISY